MKIFDTHIHLSNKRYDRDRKHYLTKEFAKLGIDFIVNPAIDFNSNQRMYDILSQYNNVFFGNGIHPAYVGNVEMSKKNMDAIKAFAKNEKCVAIGETGLDYYRIKDAELHSRQEAWFRYHIELSKELDKPLILHIREADKDGLKILKSYSTKFNGVCHCFRGSSRIAKKYIKLGFYLGIGGSLLRKNDFKRLDYYRFRKAVKRTPLEYLVLETDGPYLKPDGYEQNINSSLSLPLIIEEIAKIKGISPEIVANTTYQNAKKLFNIN